MTKEKSFANIWPQDVEGNVYGKLYGSLFQHKSKISLRRPNVKVLLQTEQLIYRQRQTGNDKGPDCLTAHLVNSQNGHFYLG